MTEQKNLEIAIQNLPTKERYAKGDVIIYEKSDENERATMPTSRVRVEKTRIVKLLNARVLDMDQYLACWQLRQFWDAAIREVVPPTKTATWAQNKEAMSNRIEYLDMLIHNQHCYNQLRSKYMDPVELTLLEKVVCNEYTIDRTMKGRKHTKTKRFTDMVDKLKKSIDQINA